MIVPPIGGLSAELPAAATEGLGHGVGAVAPEGLGGGQAANGASSSFGGELIEAISSLEGTQRSANAAEQALATGKVADPESAVVTVEDAAMAMELAAQIRSKATEAAQTIFQTQV
jgi:flagellar hook-basal body complex protein FliE